MESQSAGKGSKPRPSVYTKEFKQNHDEIDWSKKRPGFKAPKSSKELRAERRRKAANADRALT